ncbi:hypothetical protein SARC_13324 [Sphaeroforma arctica JP610]|uniref:Uncharacterized protein n=1 Tax=Sphaeroforma arctica JP610 TaxID=667725 RepID=A0A0L0FBM0_9EUKA|nr:hypothetical protein SARC_13324 [Sphaeroforma arctica JP610]KNC74119.1 hypothetical protein SARC_13324 [Sphaeroforma arctica JP610]|eukprot:XP_014148021.1 hypothetical protein SARC_13324 [Sphaeroforma arctica JP610]
MISASYPEWDDLFGQYVQFPVSTISVLSYTGRPPRAQAGERDDPQYNTKCRKVSNREALLLDAFDQAWFRLQKKSVDKLVAWVFDALNEHAEHPYRVNVLVLVLDHTIAQKITSMKQIIDTWEVVFTPHRQHIWREMNALLVKRVHLCQVHELTVILRYVTGQLSRAGDEIAQQELHKYSQSLVQAHAHAQAYSYANHSAQAPTHASVLNGAHKKKNFSIDTSIHDRLGTDARQRSGSLGLVRVHTDTPQPSSKVDNARNQGNASTRAVSPAFAPSGSTAGKLVNCNVAVTQAIPLIRKIMHSSALVPQYVVFHEAFKIRNKQHWRVRQHVDRLLFQFQSLANMLRPIGWYHPAVRPVLCLTTNMAGWRVFGPDSCLFPMVGKLLNMASEMMDSKESEVMTQFLSDVLMQYTSTIGLREYLRGMDHFKIKTDSFFQTALAEMVISVLRIEHSQKSARLRNAGSAENVVKNGQAIEDVARGADNYTAVDVDTEWHLLASHFFALLRVDEVDLEMVIRTVHTKIRAIWGDEFRSNRVVWLIHQCAFSEELKNKFKDSYTRVIEPALSMNKTAGQALAPKSSLYDLLFSLYDSEATNANTVEGDKWDIQDLSIEFLLRRLFPSESGETGTGFDNR